MLDAVASLRALNRRIRRYWMHIFHGSDARDPKVVVIDSGNVSNWYVAKAEGNPTRQILMVFFWPSYMMVPRSSVTLW